MIDHLHLVGPAKECAAEIAREVSGVVFTSGRRELEDQAAAMAKNCARQRSWILGDKNNKATYVWSRAAQLCHDWSMKHHTATVAQLTAAFTDLLKSLPDEELLKLSKHLTGKAFDIRPVLGEAGKKMLAKIRAIVAKYGGILLEREGSLIVWHAQF